MRNLLLLASVKLTICQSECRYSYRLTCLLVDKLVASDRTKSECPAGDRTDNADEVDDEESFEKLFEQLRVMKGLVTIVSLSFVSLEF